MSAEGLTRRLVPSTTPASGTLPTLVTSSNNLVLGGSSQQISTSGRQPISAADITGKSSSSSSLDFEQENLEEKEDGLKESARRQSKWRTVLGRKMTLLPSCCVRNRSCSVPVSVTNNLMFRCYSCSWIAGDDGNNDDEESQNSSSWMSTRGETCKRFWPNIGLSFLHFLFPSSSVVMHHSSNLSSPTLSSNVGRAENTPPTKVTQNTPLLQLPATEVAARGATTATVLSERVASDEQKMEDEDENKSPISNDEADDTLLTEDSLFFVNSAVPKEKEPCSTTPSPAPTFKNEAKNKKGLPDYRYCKVDLPPSKPGLDVVFVGLSEDDSESSESDDDYIAEIKGGKSEASKTSSSLPQPEVRFYLRFPNHDMNAATKEQAKRERAERAERTADFVEVAKALSLRLSRDSWSGRRRLSSGGVGGGSSSNSSLRQHIQRSRSSSSSMTPATTFPLGSTRRMSGDGVGRGVTTRSSQLRRNSIGTMPTGNHTNEDGTSGYDLRHMAQSLQSSHSISLSIEESGIDARKINRQQDLAFMSPKPKRRSSGFGALSPRSSISRENSSDSLHRLLEDEMMLRKSSLDNPKGNDDALMRERLGYEDLDVPLKNEGGATHSQPYMASRRSSLSSVHTSSASSCLGYEEGEGPQPVRPTRYRAQRRASFVAGSKIERYDDNEGKKKTKTRRRGSGAYTDWQLEILMGGG